jgi:AraC-like DNA-binding protein
VLVFESDLLGQTEEFLSTQYAPMRIGRENGEARTRVQRAVAGAVSVDRLDFGFEMTYDVTPLGRISLCDISSGTIEDHAPEGQQQATFGAGELFSFSPPDRGYRGRINHASYTITMLDPAVFDDLVGRRSDGAPVRLLDHRPASPAAAARLRAAIDHLDRHVLATPAAEQSPLVVANAVRYVAAQVLDTFASTAALDPDAIDERDARPATLRRAIAYIEEHAGLDLTPAEIAEAAHVSVRALQLAFRRHLDTTPMAYLRRVRLEGAHRDLVAGDPADGSTVSTIAARWGFGHQGRFGISYREAYGETPGRTLRGR